ncbi:MAG: glycosyltransferase family 2 protein [Bacteroidetes bacterium]|nr:glycosyltransferase family 2 protein [Bacteroidota bacterium]
MKLSVVIPSHNEAENLTGTITQIFNALSEANIDHEILVINDHSKDETRKVLEELTTITPSLKILNNENSRGYGYAVRYGLEKYNGDCVAIMMADLSDSADDLVLFYKKMIEGNYDCVFGSRFIKGSKVIDYPFPKLFLNRFANFFINISFRLRYNDITNAFKLYKRETIDGIKPLMAPHYNLTLEMPLKSIVRGFSYTVLPNSWTNRQHGISKFRIKEMGSRYLFIYFYCLIEKFFSRGDFKKTKNPHRNDR